MVIMRLENLACLEEVCICLCFIVCVMLSRFQRIVVGTGVGKERTGQEWGVGYQNGLN